MQEHLEQEFEASFENLTGLVAVSFSDDNIDKEVEDLHMLPLLLGLDFNVDPMAGICAVKHNDCLMCSMKLYTESNNLGICGELLWRYVQTDELLLALTLPERRKTRSRAWDHNILREVAYSYEPKNFWKIR